jgi:hypothetical protein
MLDKLDCQTKDMLSQEKYHLCQVMSVTSTNEEERNLYSIGRNKKNLPDKIDCQTKDMISQEKYQPCQVMSVTSTNEMNTSLIKFPSFLFFLLSEWEAIFFFFSYQGREK